MKRHLRLFAAALFTMVMTTWQADAQVSVFPFADDFESNTTCSGSCNATCTFNNGWSNETAGGDGGNWITDVGGTSSSSTGPSVDYNPGTSAGNYLYFESSSPCYTNVTAYLYSPVLDLTGVGGLNMVFAWHMYGTTQGTMSIDVSTDGGATWIQNLWSRSGDNGDVWEVDTVSLSAFAGLPSVTVRVDGLTSTSFTSDMAVDDFLFYEPLPIDVAVTAIPSPGLPSCNLTNSLVEATIQNFGTDTITSFDVEWWVNAVAQPTVAWTGVLPANADTTITVSASYTFVDGDVLAVASTSPNGTTPTNGTSNDTLTIDIQSGLSGVYTLGAGGDYTTFAAAVADLNTFGVCSHVIFDVLDGTYTEQMSLGPVGGMGANATVTFRGQNADPALVNLTYAATGTVDNYVIQLAGGSWYRFENMSISPTGTTYGTAIDVGGNSHQNMFSKLTIAGDANVSTTSTNMALITSFTGENDTMNVFDSLDCRYGSYAMYWYGINTTSLEKGTSITNSNFTDFYYRGIHLYYMEDVNVSNNTLMPGPNYTGSIYRMYLYYNNGIVNIDNNLIGGDRYGYGIYMSNCTAPANQRGSMRNNSWSIGDSTSTSTSYCMYFTNTANFDVSNNSTYMSSDGTSSRAIYMTGGTGNNVYNNIFMNDGPGYGAYILGGIAMMDYNAYYTPNGRVGYFGGDLVTMMDWQNTTGYDAMGVYGDPMYTAYGDLHTCADSLVGSNGMMDSMLVWDFDGQTRPMTPDIGADEILDLSNYTLGFDTVMKCSTDFIPLGGMEPADDATYIWSTNETTPTINANNAGAYTVLVTSACGTAFEQVIVEDIPDAVADFSTWSSFFTAVFTNNSVGGTSYAWDFGDGGTSTDMNPTHVYQTAGTYTVTLTVTGPCGTDTYTDDFIATTTGLDQAEENFLLNVYPNPNNGQFDIQIDLESAKDVVFTLVDVTGKEVWSARPGSINGTYVQHVNVDNQARGMYMLQIKVGEYTTMRKVIMD